ncbi:aqualysin-1-like [Glandiceps talaboti]
MRLMILSLFVVAVAAISPTIERRLKDTQIVVLKDGHDNIIRDHVVQQILARYPEVKLVRQFNKVVNGFSMVMTPEVAEQVRRFPEVAYVQQNMLIQKDYDVDSWGLDRVDQTDLPLDNAYLPRGDASGVNAYVIDTGIRYDHVDFEGRAGLFIDVVEEPAPDGDCDGHGTHCAGILGGALYGVAKQVALWNVRVLDCQGYGVTDDLIFAMDYVVENGELPAVISMSLGGSRNPVIDDAVGRLVDAGFFYVTSGGNLDDDACLQSPQGAPKAFSVGSTTQTDSRSSFSNWGPCIDIYAPGSFIKSTYYTSPTATAILSGTSMACPHVAGAGAVQLNLKPDATPDEIGARLQGDATPDRIQDAKEAEGTPNLLLYIGEEP